MFSQGTDTKMGRLQMPQGSCLYFMDFVFINFAHPPSEMGLCFRLPNLIYWMQADLPDCKLRPERGSLNCKNSPKVEFSSEKIKLVILIGTRVEGNEGEQNEKEKKNSQKLLFLCDYNQLSGLASLFQNTRERKEPT